jgi:chromosome segregation ATPase
MINAFEKLQNGITGIRELGKPASLENLLELIEDAIDDACKDNGGIGSIRSEGGKDALLPLNRVLKLLNQIYDSNKSELEKFEHEKKERFKEVARKSGAAQKEIDKQADDIKVLRERSDELQNKIETIAEQKKEAVELEQKRAGLQGQIDDFEEWMVKKKAAIIEAKKRLDELSAQLQMIRNAWYGEKAQSVLLEDAIPGIKREWEHFDSEVSSIDESLDALAGSYSKIIEKSEGVLKAK